MNEQARSYSGQWTGWQRWLGYLPWLLIPLLIWWALRHVPLRQLAAIISQIPASQILGLLALNVLVMLSFAGRWWIILRGMGYDVPFGWLSLHRLASFGWSYFTPGPQFGGEPVQAYLASQRHDVPLTTSAASVGLDRLLELVVNFSMLAAGAAWTLRSGLIDGRAGVWAAGAAAGLLALPLVFLGALWRGHRPVSWLLGQIKSERLAPFITGVAQSETRASALIRRKPAVIAGALAASLFSWALMILEYGLAVRVVGLNLTVTQIIMAMTAARVALLAPLPGGLGTLEAGQVAAFEAMGLAPAAGLALVLIIRARDVLFGVAGLGWSSTVVKRWNQSTE